jgi:hypothetical protein
VKHALFSYKPIFQDIYAFQVSLIGKLVDVVARKDREFSGVVLHLQVGCCTEKTKNVGIMFRIFNAASKQTFERRSKASKRRSRDTGSEQKIMHTIASGFEIQVESRDQKRLTVRSLAESSLFFKPLLIHCGTD